MKIGVRVEGLGGKLGVARLARLRERILAHGTQRAQARGFRRDDMGESLTDFDGDDDDASASSSRRGRRAPQVTRTSPRRP